jgi:glycosyltransferase involved in cell wall biosynthesis
MIHLVTWLPLPYQRTLCRTLSDVYGPAFVAWFAETAHEEFPYSSGPQNSFPHHYLSDVGYGQFFRELKKDSEAIIILCGWSSPMTNKTLLMATLLRIPVLIWADHPHPRKRSWVAQRSRIFYLRLLGRIVSGFLACGNQTVEHLVSLGIDRKKITTFPYWVELPEEWALPIRCLDENEARRPLRLLAIGRHVPVKQFGIAIEAVALANKKAGRELAVLAMVGDGPERAALEMLARTLDSWVTVSFRGWLESDEIYQALREADALVLTSRFDAYGAVVLETMAAGRPVLASTGVVAALDRDEGTGGILLHPIGDIDTLAEQIALLACDHERLSKASLSSRATAEKWPPARAVTIIDGMLGKTKRGRILLKRKQHFAGCSEIEDTGDDREQLEKSAVANGGIA